MRRTAAAMALVFGLTASRPAVAGKCYVDSDCPTGMVCNSEGGCVVPAGSTGAPSRGASGTRLVIYALVLGVVIVAILVPAMRATDEANGGRAGLDDFQLRQRTTDPLPATCGLTMRF